MKIVKDNFISKHLNIKSYILNLNKEKTFNQIEKIKKPYFLTLKSNHSINLKQKKERKIYFICKQITFCKTKKFNTPLLENNCFFAKKSDLSNLKKICLEKTSNSRFVQDQNLPSKFKENLRYNWLKNFFLKKRGNYLVIYKKKRIKGFVLLLKKKNKLIIDLIVIGKKDQNKGIGKILIKYIENKLMKKGDLILAGTQSNNKSAVKFYKKLQFKKKQSKYVYHVFYPKKLS